MRDGEERDVLEFGSDTALDRSVRFVIDAGSSLIHYEQTK